MVRFICVHCKNPVGYWGYPNKEGGYWKHQRGWNSPPSCGLRLTRRDIEEVEGDQQ